MYICTVQYKASIYYSKDTSPSILRINEDFLCIWVLSEQQLETANYSSTPYMFQSLDILKISLPSNRFWLYRGSLTCLNSIWADLCCLLKTKQKKNKWEKLIIVKLCFSWMSQLLFQSRVKPWQVSTTIDYRILTQYLIYRVINIPDKLWTIGYYLFALVLSFYFYSADAWQKSFFDLSHLFPFFVSSLKFYIFTSNCEFYYYLLFFTWQSKSVGQLVSVQFPKTIKSI